MHAAYFKSIACIWIPFLSCTHCIPFFTCSCGSLAWLPPSCSCQEPQLPRWDTQLSRHCDSSACYKCLWHRLCADICCLLHVPPEAQSVHLASAWAGDFCNSGYAFCVWFHTWHSMSCCCHSSPALPHNRLQAKFFINALAEPPEEVRDISTSFVMEYLLIQPIRKWICHYIHQNHISFRLNGKVPRYFRSSYQHLWWCNRCYVHCFTNFKTAYFSYKINWFWLHVTQQVANYLVPRIRTVAANDMESTTYIKYLTSVKAYQQILGVRQNYSHNQIDKSIQCPISAIFTTPWQSKVITTTSKFVCASFCYSVQRLLFKARKDRYVLEDWWTPWIRWESVLNTWKWTLSSLHLMYHPFPSL